jgi:phosphatidylserine decarboxylase
MTVILTTGICVALRFYRDPERRVPDHDGCILSPADGSIRYIKPFSNGEIPIAEKNHHKYKLSEFTGTDILDNGGISVGIEMNLLDVHVNRSPIPGRVQLLRPMEGPFLSLRRPDAIYKNERVTTVIENGTIRIGVVQIASRLVRRIISYVSEGDLLQAGQRIGMIRFGSQVDLIIPKRSGLVLSVSTDQRVKAGVSVIAKYKKQEQI